MPRLLRIITQICPLIFAILAFAFSLKYITSKNWSYRRFYPGDFPENFKAPAYSQYRSPFIICNAEAVQVVAANGSVIPGYVERCIRYPVWANHTSCELPVVTQNDSVENVGDRRQCQQIHYAGNLSIAGTTFIGLGFFLTLIMTMVSVLLLTSAPESQSSSIPTTITASAKTEDDDEQPHALPAHQRRRYHRILNPTSPYVNLALIVFFVLGAILTILAQFYGVLAFTISAPDNGVFDGVPLSGFKKAPDHEPWVQGSALSVFASLTWLCAAIGACLAGMVWRIPRLEKVV
jgi:hypothetical protein